jgi:NADH:ubiquinone oxidoreductase subunit 4 (subunit M)
MSAYYALRLYQQTMHNRPASQQSKGLLSREIGLRDGLVLAPLVLCILALALYPQLVLERTAPTVKQTVAKVSGGEALAAQRARELHLTEQKATEILTPSVPKEYR